MRKIERALLSVSDKRGVVEFARALDDLNVEILSTGGTAGMLQSAGIPVRQVSEETGFPEMLDGRVKTLHPRIHGGLLAVRDNPDHQAQMAAQGMRPIDLVCVNLYPFTATIAREDTTFRDAIENIDIGGPSMLRSAAKNFEDVAVVTDPDDYPALIEELKTGGGGLGRERRFALARQAFAHTARYDGAIAQYLSRLEPVKGGFEPVTSTDFPRHLFLDFEAESVLRYGENPHQGGAFYRCGGHRPHGLAAALQLQGKELSYNNLMDLQAAWELVSDLKSSACVIIKHTNPCGAGSADTLAEAYSKALAGDPVSAFGSVVAVNVPLDGPTASKMSELFIEAIIAPRIEPEARERFGDKTNLRLLEMTHDPENDGAGNGGEPSDAVELRSVAGGLLVQSRDGARENVTSSKVVTSRKPTDDEWRDLDFAWNVARHVKSNAIVLAKDGRTLGVGAGQMSRVDAVRLSLEKAGPLAAGSVLASDAFFPFRDGLDLAAGAGVRAVIQPGGSRRDEEVIQSAEEHGVTMAFTGVRHFKH